MTPLQTLKSEKDKVDKRIKALEYRLIGLNKNRDEQIEYSTDWAQAVAIIRELNGDLREEKARLEALNLGIQAVENTIKDVLEIIDKFTFNYYDCEISYKGNFGSFENWCMEEKDRIKSHLQKEMTK